MEWYKIMALLGRGVIMEMFVEKSCKLKLIFHPKSSLLPVSDKEKAIFNIGFHVKVALNCHADFTLFIVNFKMECRRGAIGQLLSSSRRGQG